MENKRVWGIIVGGGNSVRYGGDVPKQFLMLGDKWVFDWSLDCFDTCKQIDGMIAVVPDEWVEACKDKWQRYFPKLHSVISGGSYRFDSVSNALALLTDTAEIVLIHDAARPGVTEQLIHKVLTATESNGAALPVMPVPATVKKVYDNIVHDTFDRTKLRLAQTPQGFQLAYLLLGIQKAGDKVQLATDEIQLVERLPGVSVAAVPGLAQNEKITTEQDFETITNMLTQPQKLMETRTGIGYDAHRLVAGRPLILGGVEFVSPVGLLGHSDADVLCHAIADALLGAASLGDIGQHFPDTDPKWKDANSIELLRQVNQLLIDNEYSIVSVDATILLEAPKVMSRRLEMGERIASGLQISASQVSIKATTNEGMGFIGKHEGAAAMAVATIKRTVSQENHV